MLHRNGVVQKRFSKVKVGVVGAITDNDVIRIDIHRKPAFQIVVGRTCHRHFQFELTVRDQNRHPVQHRKCGGVQAQNVESLDVKFVCIGKTVAIGLNAPFFRKVFAFRTIEPKAEVVADFAEFVLWDFNNALGTVKNFHGHSISLR